VFDELKASFPYLQEQTSAMAADEQKRVNLPGEESGLPSSQADSVAASSTGSADLECANLGTAKESGLVTSHLSKSQHIRLPNPTIHLIIRSNLKKPQKFLFLLRS
jgi:hypothetical protein